jgi:hypothetical protein
LPESPESPAELPQVEMQIEEQKEFKLVDEALQVEVDMDK